MRSTSPRSPQRLAPRRRALAPAAWGPSFLPALDDPLVLGVIRPCHRGGLRVAWSRSAGATPGEPLRIGEASAHAGAGPASRSCPMSR